MGGSSACVDVLENREITALAGNQTQHSSAHSLVSNHLLLPQLKQPIFIYGNVTVCVVDKAVRIYANNIPCQDVSSDIPFLCVIWAPHMPLWRMQIHGDFISSGVDKYYFT
jgi:hypothetical protein